MYDWPFLRFNNKSAHSHEREASFRCSGRGPSHYIITRFKVVGYQTDLNRARCGIELIRMHTAHFNLNQFFVYCDSRTIKSHYVITDHDHYGSSKCNKLYNFETIHCPFQAYVASIASPNVDAQKLFDCVLRSGVQQNYATWIQFSLFTIVCHMHILDVCVCVCVLRARP